MITNRTNKIELWRKRYRESEREGEIERESEREGEIERETEGERETGRERDR